MTQIVILGMMACSWFSIGLILIISMERFFGIVFSMKIHLRDSKIIFGTAAGYLLLVLAAG